MLRVKFIYSVLCACAVSIPHPITFGQKQSWLADDASGAGSIKDVLKWWQPQEKMGPVFGYHPNALKCWLIVKPNKYEEAMEAFQNTGINVTTEGRRHLGAALG